MASIITSTGSIDDLATRMKDLKLTLKNDEALAYLDINIDETTERYNNCVEFVKTKNLAYGLSSNRLVELQGSELARLPELYESDYDTKQKRMIVRLPNQRIVVKLFTKVAPLACQNFLALCTGEKGKGKSGKPLHYLGTPFHRIVKKFVAQSGDVNTGTGSGGESIWGKNFKDDRLGLKKKIDKRGLLCMCNTGKNSNTSQFFFSFDKLPKLTGKHVVFGEIVLGMDVLDQIEAAGSEGEGKPTVEVVIQACGKI
jgi:peptidylprolyl isomerase